MIDQTTKLDLGNKSISSIEGLQLFTNLGHGDKPDVKSMLRTSTQGNSAGNLDPEATELDLSGNRLTDISTLSTLTNLQTLNLSNNQISDITPLAGLTNLRLLGLSRNKIIDHQYNDSNNSANGLDPLAHLNMLDSLDLSFNKLNGFPLFDKNNNFISSFAPLSRLPLRQLNLSHNRIMELGTDSLDNANANPFSTMRNLRYLDLSFNQIGNIQFLNALNPSEDGLAYLNLNQNRLQDESGSTWQKPVLAPIAHLTHLYSLGLGFNHVNDLKPLNGLTNLFELNLTGTQSVDLTPLSKLTNLQQLYIGVGSRNYTDKPYPDPNNPGGFRFEQIYTDGSWDNNDQCGNDQGCIIDQPLSDITPLKNLNKLETLYLNNSAITDLTPLATMTSLSKLDLSSEPQNGDRVGKISDVTPLGELNNLSELYLRGNRISDITALTRFDRIRQIDVSGNIIHSLPSLEELHCIESFIAEDNQIERIVEPSTTTKFNGSLDLKNNRIQDLMPLAKYDCINELRLDNNQISDISPIAHNNVGGLFLTNNRISDISTLAGNREIVNLFLSNNKVKDITALRTMASLAAVDLCSNQVADITPIASLQQLKYLYLSGNGIDDITPLKNLINLRYLWLENNHISDATPLAGLTKLSSLTIGKQNISLPSAAITPTMTVESARGLDGTHLQPMTITPDSGIYDKTTGLVSWKQLNGIDHIGLSFNQNIQVGTANAIFSGTISQEITSSGSGTTPTPATHTVTFNSTGGSAVNSEIINTGDKAIEPNPPTREGFVFNRWQIKDNNGKLVDYDFGKVLTSDITLYATWTHLHRHLRHRWRHTRKVADHRLWENCYRTCRSEPQRVSVPEVADQSRRQAY
ncbi:leucine-rich repeat domain-containing protein [Bifidobacterium sp. ESL0798]|uniref:leucine-rich repeat domain-containing protein n=1 Tax=Bifidobacterium sp. ESL0798 TaxID=2983235 RepID=UPI0023F73E27|nr:leucine-rich repeat domain-containing protein [Bifidobacterium sp. ESL0798]